MPRRHAPAPKVPTVAPGDVAPAEDAPSNDARLEFDKRCAKMLASSSDTRERAQVMADEPGVTALRVGCALRLAAARDWGLFIGAPDVARSKNDPARGEFTGGL